MLAHSDEYLEIDPSFLRIHGDCSVGIRYCTIGSREDIEMERIFVLGSATPPLGALERRTATMPDKSQKSLEACTRSEQ
jgi:hypothetical protein